nr:PEPxxWA-CTERM sorting domain-containing protein [uncultured Sphingomonas sp.]
MAAAGAACLAVLASAPLAISALGAQEIELAGVTAARNVMALLDGRSPGERAKGALTQSKVRLSQTDKPRARALGKVFPPKPSPMEQLSRVVVASPPPVAPLEVVSVDPPVVPGPVVPASLSSVPLTVGSVIVGGSVLPPPPNIPPPPGGVPGAVPEPGTWLMMLLGFGMVGSAMSRRKARAAVAMA